MLLVIGLSIFLLLRITQYIYTKITTPSIFTTGDIQTGTDMTFLGTIKDENKFPIYTHIISNARGESLYLKSTSLNLNNYPKDVEIVGTIQDIYKGIPVLQVHTIKLPDQGIVIKNNAYLFRKDLLYLDFSNQNQLSAERTDKEIIVKYDGKKLFSIEHFLCSKVLKNKSCSFLIEDYDQEQKENFDSYRGYTFYRHGTGLWTVFDGTKFGYIFKGIDDSMMLDMSSMIRIIDKNFIITNKEQQIKEACKIPEGQISQFTFSSVEHKDDDNDIALHVEGSVTKKKSVTCNLTFDMRNGRKIKTISVK